MAYFCHVCFGEAHSFTNLFHAAEIWEVNNNSRTVIGLQVYLYNNTFLLQNGMFKPVVIENRVIDVLPKHKCSTTKTIDVCCIDAKGKYDRWLHICTSRWYYYNICILVGIEHNVDFRCCQCEPVAVTMVRARLWPATPQFPRLAFTFELLDWAETLLLECQVALQDLCKALYFKCPRIVVKVCKETGIHHSLHVYL